MNSFNYGKACLKNAYIYPISARYEKVVANNPYIDDFIGVMEKRVNFVNKNNPSSTGFFDLLKYLFQIDYVFFNWIEDVPDKKGGLAQAVFLLFFLYIANFMKIKVFWTIHNKLSHSKDHFLLKKMISKTLLKTADWIITHSSEGIQYAESIVPGCRDKIVYLPHPIKNRKTKNSVEKKIDILIWGTISPYKGIVEFLKYLHDKRYQNKYEILVIGRVTSKELFDLLSKYSNQHIVIKDECPDFELLQSLIGQSRLVLFTYSKSSILSSGALMDSLGFGARIIGPNVGAFTDLKSEGLIETFDDFDDLFKKLNDWLNSEDSFIRDNERISLFLRDNSWDAFAENLSKSTFVFGG
jgi:beta-1,4-mannosyltransferase